MRVFCRTCRQYSQNFSEEQQTCIFCNSIFIDRIVQEITRIPFSKVVPNQRNSTSPQIISQALYVPSHEFIIIDNSDRATSKVEILRRLAAVKSRPFDKNRFGAISCVICLELLNDTVAELRCDHTYHVWCIRNWLKQKNMCPLCTLTVAP